MAEVDIDSLLQDLSSLETSPQHQNSQYRKNLLSSSSTQENLHPQKHQASSSTFTASVPYASTSTPQRTSANGDDGAMDDSTLAKILELLPAEDPVVHTAPTQQAPICPLKRRPLKESRTPVVVGAEAGTTLMRGDGMTGGEADYGGEMLQHASPRPPPPRKRTGLTPQPAGTGSDDEGDASFTFDAILDGVATSTPPVSPSPQGARAGALELDVEFGVSAAGGGLDVSDFDAGDSPRGSGTGSAQSRMTKSTGSRPTTAASPDAVASAVADGTVPSLDPDSLSEELAALLGPAAASSSSSSSYSYSSSSSSSTTSSSFVASGSFTALPLAPSVSELHKKLRCMKATLHGPSAVRGHKQSSFARDVVCGNLRCLKCNFSVRTYPHAAWDSSVDYMFFRNGFPDDAKLGARLVAGAASCAYCCQCGWASTGEEVEVKDLGLQWSCSGHAP